MLIPFEEIARDYDPDIRGIVHVGAHLGEEAQSYDKAGVESVIWIEGNQELTVDLLERLKRYPGHKVITAIVGDVDGQDMDFRVTSNRMSSSLLPLAKHKKYHPNVQVETVKTVTTRRIDNLISLKEILDGNYTFVNLDLQGAELMALKGMGELLDEMKWVYVEVNLTDIYRGCPLLSDVDTYMLDKGFVRRKTRITKYMWGDALYQRRTPRILDRISMRTSACLYRLFRWRKAAFEPVNKAIVRCLVIAKHTLIRLLK
jgi:FkbM family methyltransferase